MVYKYLEHTADAKFEVVSQTYEELFIDSVFALENLVVSTKTVSPDVIKKVNIASYDMVSLLHDFLEEMIFLLEADRFLVSEIANIEIDSENFTLHAKLKGEVIDPEKHELLSNVKAVTYNDMKVEKTDDGYKAVVVIDL